LYLTVLHIYFALFTETLLSQTFSSSCSVQNATGMPQAYTTMLILHVLKHIIPEHALMKLTVHVLLSKTMP